MRLSKVDSKNSRVFMTKVGTIDSATYKDKREALYLHLDCIRTIRVGSTVITIDVDNGKSYRINASTATKKLKALIPNF